MSDTTTPPATPWDFKARGFVFGMIYAIGFFAGICALVPRLIPRLRPAVIASARSPAWSDGFLSEIFHVAIILATLCNALFTWQQPGPIVWIILLVGIIVSSMILHTTRGKSQPAL